MLELGSVIPPMSSYTTAEVLPLPAKPHQAQHQTYTTSPNPPNRKHNPSFHPHEIANEIPRVPTHPRLCHPPPGQAQRPEPRSRTIPPPMTSTHSPKTQAPRKRTALTRTAKFLQRARVLSFYRTILRGTRQIQDPRTKSETRKFVRDEFERHRGVTDIVSSRVFFLFLPQCGRVLTMQSHIRYLLSTGKTEWESMERYIGGM